MAKPPVSLGFIVVNTMMLWLTVGISSVVLWPIYESVYLAILVAVALLLGSALAVVGVIYRWSSIVVMVSAVAVYLLIGVPLAVPGAALYGVLPTLDGLRSLLAASVVGWKQLVTITLPVGEFEALLVPALFLVFFGAVIGLSLALRAKYGEIAAVVPATIFIIAVAFGAETTDWPFPWALALLISLLVWHIWARWYRRRASIQLLVSAGKNRQSERTDTGAARLGIRTIIGAVLTMLVAAAAGVAAVSVAPVTVEREVVRTAIEKPFDPSSYASPLSAFRTNFQSPLDDPALFTVSGLPKDGLIRIATLDNYDGVVYSVGSGPLSSESGTFVRIPTSFDQSQVTGDPISVAIKIENYQGVWLPTVGKLESVTFGGKSEKSAHGSLFYNDTSGTAVVTKGISQGMRYQLEAVLPEQPSVKQEHMLEPGPASVPPPQLLPDELAFTLSNYIGQAQAPGARLHAMLEGIRTDGYISHGVGDDEPPSRSGHAADRITQLMTDQRMIGDAEQYAVTAALMAGELGFPARVVYGYAPESSGGSGPVIVHGYDASAWIEINTNRFGWVTIDPNPKPRPIPEETPEEIAQVARPQSPVQPPPTEPDFVSDQVQPEIVREEAPEGDSVAGILLIIAQIIGWVLAAAIILLAPFLIIAAAKIRRRRLRRKAPTAIARVSGGWSEFEDAVLDHGFSPPRSSTRTEVAQTVGGTRALVLASVVDRAVFSPDETDDEQANRVWRAVNELRDALAEGRTLRDRIRALISLRSLGSYSGKSLFTR